MIQFDDLPQNIDFPQPSPFAYRLPGRYRHDPYRYRSVQQTSDEMPAWMKMGMMVISRSGACGSTLH